ncbi:MAG: class I SAM-dependent methyltransferase [Alphaproteobacteria bacterium]|uniref:class I SAM-dependent methyltransferase n=1 Tax=Marinobacter salarius TaxID=1420917 RepID=UPI0032EAE229
MKNNLQDTMTDSGRRILSKRRTYKRVAWLYDLLDLPFEYGRYRALRRLIFRDAHGRVLDAGVGTGRNMPFYPPGARVTGIDLSEAMLARAERRSARLGVLVELRAGSVLHTEFADCTFDVIVATFLFCVLDDADQKPALEELARICKLTGEIRILEYVYPRNRFKRAIMRLWVPWVRWFYGAAFDRDTERYVSAAGLKLVESRLVYKDIIKLLTARPSPLGSRECTSKAALSERTR